MLSHRILRPNVGSLLVPTLGRSTLTRHLERAGQHDCNHRIVADGSLNLSFNIHELPSLQGLTNTCARHEDLCHRISNTAPCIDDLPKEWCSLR